MKVTFQLYKLLDKNTLSYVIMVMELKWVKAEAQFVSIQGQFMTI